jgi:hypothetical protein
MRSVKSAIRQDQFYYAMIDMAEWQVREGINPAFYNYQRDQNGDCIFNVTFSGDSEAENFVRRFGGSLLVGGHHPFTGPVGTTARPGAWAPRRGLAH